MCDVGLDLYWDNLLDFIQAGEVIPIIGPDLLRVEHEGGQVSLYGLVARLLADNLRVPRDRLPIEPTLNDVVCEHLQNRGRREDIYPGISRILKNLELKPTDTLRKLARIRGFDLFISTTFDSLLARVLDEVRPGNATPAEEISYLPNSAQDLPADWRPVEFDRGTQWPIPRPPTVFHLFGKAAPAPNSYVANEEDMLEFVFQMQANGRKPNLLFDELKRKHLLIIGCELSDWLARFFIRMARSGKLSQQRDEMEVWVDSRITVVGNQASFFDVFSYNTKQISTTPVEFVDRLFADLEQRGGTYPDPSDETPPVIRSPDRPSGPLPDEMKSGSIFISYPSEDREAALRLRDFLYQSGLDVWFDRSELKGGQDFEAMIRRHIMNCAYFLPIVSRTVVRRYEGFFRLEWRIAVSRKQQLADHIPFIQPVVIDDTPMGTDLGQDAFNNIHWHALPGGEGTTEFAEYMKRLMRDHERRRHG